MHVPTRDHMWANRAHKSPFISRLARDLIWEQYYDIKYHRPSVQNLNAGTIPSWKIMLW